MTAPVRPEQDSRTRARGCGCALLIALAAWAVAIGFVVAGWRATLAASFVAAMVLGGLLFVWAGVRTMRGGR